VGCNEADDAEGTGDGSTTGDVHGADGFTTALNVTDLFEFDANLGAYGTWVGTIQLRAERDGNGEGRRYEITAWALDSYLNPGMSTCVVVVPHDRRGGEGD
jgi:hypothetical protein